MSKAKQRLTDLPESFCWSKMGVEAGENLATIIRRKEIERRATGGIFTWGVGTSVGKGLEALRRQTSEPEVMFSEIRSKPSKYDANPGRLLLWLTYFDVDGEEHFLPEYSIVTSRGETTSRRPKTRHYALMCESGRELSSEPIGTVNAGSFVNLVSGKPVGFSQVTSAVRRLREGIRESRTYNVNIRAKLTGPGQVRLGSCVEIDKADLSSVLHAAEQKDVSNWKSAVRVLKATLTTYPRAADGQQSELVFSSRNSLKRA